MLTLQQILRAARLMSQVGDPRPTHFREDDSDQIGPTLLPNPITESSGELSALAISNGAEAPSVYVDYEENPTTGEVFVVQHFSDE